MSDHNLLILLIHSTAGLLVPIPTNSKTRNKFKRCSKKFSTNGERDKHDHDSELYRKISSSR